MDFEGCNDKALMTMARKPTPLREWRISIMRDKAHYVAEPVE